MFSALEGVREAYYFNAYPKQTKYNIHILFNIQRAVVLVFITLYSWWVTVLTCAMLFPFIHDGMYYWTRHYLNPNIYRKGFIDNPSIGSTAILDFSLWERVVLFIGGSILVLISGQLKEIL